MPQVVRYRFSQRFPVSAKKAFEWCTDYAPEDHVLMGDTKGVKRQITHVTDATIILTDIFHVGDSDFEKQKLVQLYPDRFSWVSTHLNGPNKYSQFLYEIIAEGSNASRLNFAALHLEYKENLSSEAAKRLAAKLRKEDAGAWRFIAKALTKELCK